jgi:CHAT domain-containing protein
MPTTPGANNLVFVPDEIQTICKVLPDSVLLIEPGPGGSAPGAGEVPTKANVLTHLSGCTIAHFSCHGATDPTDPSQSKLLLHDHASDPLTVATLASIKLGHAQLAYLSACRTAVTDAAELIHEPIHITAALQLAGFPHVIGTLWEIDDAFSVRVADTFYTRLNSGYRIDASRAAYALHDAVRTARDEHIAVPSLWAAYVHVGA